jgi:hypothetical protein
MLFLDLSCYLERTVMSAYPGHTHTVLYCSTECCMNCTRQKRERLCAYCSLLLLGEISIWTWLLFAESWNVVDDCALGREMIVVHTVQPQRRGKNASRSCALVLNTEDCCMWDTLQQAMTLYMACCCQKWVYTVHGDAVVAFHPPPPEKGKLWCSDFDFFSHFEV